MQIRILSALIILFLMLGNCTYESENLPGRGEDSGRTVVYRDSWGVPHIYAPSEEAGAYAMGWAQAQDRPIELLKNFLRAKGELASVEGSSAFESDLLSRMWDHYGVALRDLNSQSPVTRAMVNSYLKGVTDYYSKNPRDVPPWWGDREIDEAMVYAFGRYFLYSWSIDDGLRDLMRGGIKPNLAGRRGSSNQWAVAPERSAEGVPILVIDPHLGWNGASRFWEFRIHAGNMVGSGFTLPAFPTIGLGHNENVAWAMTTGGPDTADIYELTVKPEDPSFYFFDNNWRQFTKRDLEIEVKGEANRTVQVLSSHHGPVVAIENGKAYALRTSYAFQVGVFDSWWEFVCAKDYKEFEKGLATLQLFPQNVMVADTSGNIYYQRTGRVPKRPEGYDWSRPVDGSIRQTEWAGFHDSSELVQTLNPPQGYMQNCNIPPDVMMVDSPLTPDLFVDYIFSDRSHGELGGWSNQRGARAAQLLSNDSSITAEEAVEHALDVYPFGSERWIQILKSASASTASVRLSGEYSTALESLLSWDLELRSDSTEALKYYFWRKAVSEASQNNQLVGLRAKVDNLLSSVGKVVPLPELTGAENRVILSAFSSAMDSMKEELGSLDRTYGDYFRVGRGEQSWPLGGGGDFGTATLRSVGYSEKDGRIEMWGTNGQTATQVVVLSVPIRSWTATPLGQSDRPDSPHYSDQAESIFSKRQMKESWWLPEDLKNHVESRTVLDEAPN